MFPVHVLSEGVELPKNGTFYIVARDGIFLRKENSLIDATVKIDQISFLQELVPKAALKLPKIPAKLLVRTLLFFRRVYKRSGTEAAILLHYAPDRQENLLQCPPQEASSASLDYESWQRTPGYQLVGSLHSHAGMPAFHSGTDKDDEKSFDGLHITIGRVDQPYFTISCSVVVNNNRFLTDPNDVILGIRQTIWRPRRSLTYRRPHVSREGQEYRSELMNARRDLHEKDERDLLKKTVWRKEIFYDMVLPDGIDYRSIGFPQKWMDQVKTIILPSVPDSDIYQGTRRVTHSAKGGEVSEH
ncbi:MAG TPA: Mov34/MPN/PAD-1 family protein [Patescibacteria group bacterium]|nr:Mov34/MPN/PAD-1 family protein [Patescibacteria group bacterium]